MLGRMRWYRRLRGGRRATVTGRFWGRRWVRVSPACIEPVDEDWGTLMRAKAKSPPAVTKIGFHAPDRENLSYVRLEVRPFYELPNLVTPVGHRVEVSYYFDAHTRFPAEWRSDSAEAVALARGILAGSKAWSILADFVEEHPTCERTAAEIAGAMRMIRPK